MSEGGTTVATTVQSYTITSDDADGWSFSSTYENAGSDVNGYYAILVGDKSGDADNYSFYAFEVSGTTSMSPPFDAITGHNWDPDYLTQDGFTVAAAGEAIPRADVGFPVPPRHGRSHAKAQAGLIAKEVIAKPSS